MPDRIGSFISKADLIDELSKDISSDKQITILKLEDKSLVKVPSDSNNRRITNVGYDVSIDCSRVFSLKNYTFIPSVSGKVTIEPGDTFSFNTKENVQLGKSVAALIESKVRLVSKGISHISTTIDPGWQGTLLLTFSNQSNNRINIYDGDPVATIVFFYLSTPVTELPEVHFERNEGMWQHYQDLSEIKEEERKTALVVRIVFICLIMVGLYLIYKYILDIQDYDQITREKITTAATLIGPIITLVSFISFKPILDRLVSLFYKRKLSVRLVKSN